VYRESRHGEFWKGIVMRHRIPDLAAAVLLGGLALTGFSCGGGIEEAPGGKRHVTLPAGTVHEGWYFAAGDEVIISGTVNGDAYIAAGMVQVDGEVNGDLIVAGGSVTINGQISDDVRAAGGNVECNGSVGRNFTAAGGTVRTGKESRIGGGVLAAGGTIMIGGEVTRDILLASGKATVSGTVDGNATVTGEALTLLPGGRVGGNLKVITNNKDRVEIAPDAVGGTVEIVAKQPRDVPRILGFRKGEFWFRIAWVLSLIVTTLVWMLLFPRLLASFGSTVLARPGWCILWGLAAIIAIPMLMIILAITVAGIPLAFLLLAVTLWLIYISQLSLGVAFGLRALGGDGRWRLFLASVAGVILVHVLMLVPYLGALLIVAGLILGLGSALVLIGDWWTARGQRQYIP
jgi:cytoskeletal protein CcmA (bactofilin family)